MLNNWIGMDTSTQVARKEKAKQLRRCRKYLAVARQIGLTEKSTTVRYWTQALADWRALPVKAIALKD